MHSGKLYIHASNVHQGGGRSLLSSIIESLPNSGLTVLIVDRRMPLPKDITENIQIIKVSPTIWQRVRAESWLARNCSSADTVLCFGNLPPLFKLRGHAVVFVQNRYLVDDIKLSGFSLKVRLRLTMERLWLSTRMSNANEFIVQTLSMKRLLEIKTQGKVPVQALPFVEEPIGYARSVEQPKVKNENGCDFVYVASGEPHKNHRRLIEAWCLLAEEGLFPSLCLTVDEARFPSLCGWLVEMRKRHGINVVNMGYLSHCDVLALYKKAGALIYPSNFESFGLPLIEARQASLPVLASEMDYVRDLLDPEQTFNPESAISIVGAVKRFMGRQEPTLPLLNAKGFVEHILNGGLSAIKIPTIEGL